MAVTVPGALLGSVPCLSSESSLATPKPPAFCFSLTSSNSTPTTALSHTAFSLLLQRTRLRLASGPLHAPCLPPPGVPPTPSPVQLRMPFWADVAGPDSWQLGGRCRTPHPVPAAQSPAGSGPGRQEDVDTQRKAPTCLVHTACCRQGSEPWLTTSHPCWPVRACACVCICVCVCFRPLDLSPP